jgi:hypothetical protein
MTGYIEHAMGCHPEPVEGRRAQRPVRALSMVLRPLPASWFDKLTMTAPPLSFHLQIPQDFTTRNDNLILVYLFYQHFYTKFIMFTNISSDIENTKPINLNYEKILIPANPAVAALPVFIIGTNGQGL